MGTLPRIHKTKSGKRYFVVNGRKIFINSKMTKKEASAIYKLLRKNIGEKKTKRNKSIKSVKTSNKASAVIKQYINTEPQKRKAKPKSKPFESTLNPSNRVSVSGFDRHPKDSGDKDLINSLINKHNKPLLVDYSEQGRYLQLRNDPRYPLLLNHPEAVHDWEVLASTYGLLHQYRKKRMQDRNGNPDEQKDEYQVDEPDFQQPGENIDPDNIDENQPGEFFADDVKSQKSDLRSRRSQKSDFKSRRSQKSDFKSSRSYGPSFYGPSQDFSEITPPEEDPGNSPTDFPPEEDTKQDLPKSEPFDQQETKLQFNPDTINFSLLKSTCWSKII
jgi:hypothetical protein